MTTKAVSKYWLQRQFEVFREDYDLWSFNGGEKGTKKWSTLSHNGVMFPPEYIPHKVPLIYEGTPIYLDPVNEEMATIYAKYIESDYVKNKTFNKNFWNDWKKMLTNGTITSLELCDFRKIYEHILVSKRAKTEDERLEDKKAEEKYKIAIVDGKEQPVGNFRVEPQEYLSDAVVIPN